MVRLPDRFTHWLVRSRSGPLCLLIKIPVTLTAPLVIRLPTAQTDTRIWRVKGPSKLEFIYYHILAHSKSEIFSLCFMCLNLLYIKYGISSPFTTLWISKFPLTPQIYILMNPFEAKSFPTVVEALKMSPLRQHTQVGFSVTEVLLDVEWAVGLKECIGGLLHLATWWHRVDTLLSPSHTGWRSMYYFHSKHYFSPFFFSFFLVSLWIFLF